LWENTVAIIGAWRIKYLRASRKPKQQLYSEYQKRNEELPLIGYAGYREYLKSPEWATIRQAMLAKAPRCLTCDKQACVVHHLKYDTRTLLGLDTTWLVSLCDGCHELIEITPTGKKRSLARANETLLALAAKAGRHGWIRFIRSKEAGYAKALAKDQKAQEDGDRKRRRKPGKNKRKKP
jgi:hypothetical protein